MGDIRFFLMQVNFFQGHATHYILYKKLKELEAEGIESKELLAIIIRIEDRQYYESIRDMLKDWTPFPQALDDYFFSTIEVEIYKKQHPDLVKEYPELFEEGSIVFRDMILKNREKIELMRLYSNNY